MFCIFDGRQGGQTAAFGRKRSDFVWVLCFVPSGFGMMEFLLSSDYLSHSRYSRHIKIIMEHNRLPFTKSTASVRHMRSVAPIAKSVHSCIKSTVDFRLEL